jgi:hypothetical protein
MARNQLFFVAAKSEDGDSRALHVVAIDVPAATEFWRTHWELDPSGKPEWVGAIPGVEPTCGPGPISWKVINPT